MFSGDEQVRRARGEYIGKTRRRRIARILKQGERVSMSSLFRAVHTRVVYNDQSSTTGGVRSKYNCNQISMLRCSLDAADLDSSPPAHLTESYSNSFSGAS